MSTQQPWKASQTPDDPQSVHEFVRRLMRAGPIVPLPPSESWNEMILRTSADHWNHAIEEETYDWYLECLPPKYQGRGWFAFAEGAEPLRLFVQWKNGFLTRRLTWEETDQFCTLANISLPS